MSLFTAPKNKVTECCRPNRPIKKCAFNTDLYYYPPNTTKLATCWPLVGCGLAYLATANDSHPAWVWFTAWHMWKCRM